jgi:hypothetical protein
VSRLLSKKSGLFIDTFESQAYVEFSSQQAATATKHKIDAFFAEGQSYTKKPTVVYSNPNVNPFKTLPKDAPARSAKDGPGNRVTSGGYNNGTGQGNFGGSYRGRTPGYNATRGNMNNMGGGFNRGGGFSGPQMGGMNGGFQSPMGGFQNGMGGNFGGFNRGGMMGGMRGGAGMRGGRGGMNNNMMGGMPMGGMAMGGMGGMGGMNPMGMGNMANGMQGMSSSHYATSIGTLEKFILSKKEVGDRQQASCHIRLQHYQAIHYELVWVTSSQTLCLQANPFSLIGFLQAKNRTILMSTRSGLRRRNATFQPGFLPAEPGCIRRRRLAKPTWRKATPAGVEEEEQRNWQDIKFLRLNSGNNDGAVGAVQYFMGVLVRHAVCLWWVWLSDLLLVSYHQEMYYRLQTWYENKC